MDESELERALHGRLRRINAGLQGLVTGVLFGFALFLATLWLVIKGGDPVGPHLSLLGYYFPGYDVSPLGSLLGLLYGFLSGFAVGSLTAVIYNGLIRLKRGD